MKTTETATAADLVDVAPQIKIEFIDITSTKYDKADLGDA